MSRAFRRAQAHSIPSREALRKKGFGLPKVNIELSVFFGKEGCDREKGRGEKVNRENEAKPHVLQKNEAFCSLGYTLNDAPKPWEGVIYLSSQSIKSKVERGGLEREGSQLKSKRERRRGRPYFCTLGSVEDWKAQINPSRSLPF